MPQAPPARLTPIRNESAAASARFVGVVVLAVLLLHALPSAAAAASSDPSQRATARQRATDAQVAYDLGDYLQAAKQYEEAYRLQPSPDLLFNIGQSYRRAEQPEKALNAYKAYLRNADSKASGRGPAKDRVRELEELIGRQRETASASQPAISPPKHAVGPASPKKPDSPAANTLPPSPRSSSEIKAPPLLTAPAPAQPPPQTTAPRPPWMIWAAIGGGVLIAGAATAWAVSRGDTPALPRTDLGNQDIFR